MSMRMFVGVWCCLVVLTGCRPGVRDRGAEGFGTGAVSLKGTYGVRRGAVVEPVLKVEEVGGGGGYRFEERVLGEWVADGEPAHVVSEAEMVRNFGGKVDAPVYGLGTAKMTVYKVPEGWSRGGFRTGTGYVLFAGSGALEAEKMLRD